MAVRIIQGDALDGLRSLPAESVQVCVTSPPYFALRDYGVDGQIGLEPSPADFIAALLAVFDEVKRVLRPDGVCFVNLGDSYAGSQKGTPGPNAIIDHVARQGFVGGGADARNGTATVHKTGGTYGIPAKNLLLIPERFAIAMQEAGWYVRSRIAWCKTSAMPESVRDRPTSAWEHIWMFAKSARYYYDQEAVKERLKQPTVGANLRNFWTLGPEPLRESHYAAFPSEIPKRCILAGTSERGQCPACGSPWVRVTVKRLLLGDDGKTCTRCQKNHGAPRPGSQHMAAQIAERFACVGTDTLDWQPGCACDAGDPVPQIVLDPFLGSGTTALVADRLGRDAIGIELNPTYADMARTRIESDERLFSAPVVVEPTPEQLGMFSEVM